MGTVAYESFSLQSFIAKVDVTRAGRIREWSQGEFRLYSDRLYMLKGRSSFHQWLVSSQRGTQTSQQSCWSSRQKWTSRPCEKHSWSFPIYRIRYLRPGHKWKNSSSARSNSSTLRVVFTGFAVVNATHSLLFCAIQFLCSHLLSAAHQGVVRITISVLITACDLEAGNAGTSGEDQVKLLRSHLGVERQLVGFSVASIKAVL